VWKLNSNVSNCIIFMVSIQKFSFHVITSENLLLEFQYFCLELMEGFSMVCSDLLVIITFNINLISSMNSRSDSNTLQWLCSIKDPPLQRPWKQGIVARSGVL